MSGGALDRTTTDIAQTMHLRRRPPSVYLSNLLHLLHCHQEHRQHIPNLLSSGDDVGLCEVGERACRRLQYSPGKAVEQRGHWKSDMGGVHGMHSTACIDARGGWT